MISLRTIIVLVACSTVLGQQNDYPEYQDYANEYYQDNLYHDYAERQEVKAGAVGRGGGGLGKLVVAGATAWFLGGTYHSKQAVRKYKKKFQKEQKALYSQYYNDVYKLTEQNTELQFAVEQLRKTLKETKDAAELEALQRDYDEFKQPDVDGDDRISRAEFNMYVKNYLSNYPGLNEKDYPKFEDFDHDGDGYVSFQEYAQQMALQVQQAERDQYAAQQSGSNSASRNLLADSKKHDSFQDLYAAHSK
uniref:EF-hand domain-containing protein n=1 Tax=Cyclophora tenuis TaxID=216820 RepID=A0A7S1D2H5_CYCTE|mmetsp:Transcript_17672/g.30025  ORF Transcript_17672/g.30025 Transcript_17672/m.30025 type:complete len:249 (+) Transcript_17672:84-830(+)